MKKRGFTLVELLAVIAILAILVIIALPNVLKMYNDARKNSFLNEVNSIIKVTRQQYLLGGSNENVWTNADGANDVPKLSLNGGHDIKYYVKSDSNGNIVKLQVTNGTYQYSKNGIIDNAKIEDVKTVSELEEDDVLDLNNPDSLGYVFTAYGTRWEWDDNNSLMRTVAPTYNNYNSVISFTNQNYFMRISLSDKQKDNGIIWCITGTNSSETYNSCDEDWYYSSESICNNEISSEPEDDYTYTCSSHSVTITSGNINKREFGFILNDNVYYLEEMGLFDANKEILKNAFGEENCEQMELGSGKQSIPAYVCSINDFTITVQNGNIYPHTPIIFIPGDSQNQTFK